MTMTESPPAPAVADTPAAAPSAAHGLYDWISTTDHKRIGRMWILVAMVLLVAFAILGTFVGLERAEPATTSFFGGENSYFQMWTLYRLGMVLLVVMPLFVGLATLVVPMQVGSTNIAFPRAALLAVWSFLLGAGITIVSVLAGGGWGALDGVTGDEADAIALTLVGTGMVIVALLIAAVCIATTVVSLRTPGMNLMRVPLFAWSMLVASAVWLLTLPVAIANLILMYVDLRGGPLTLGDPEASGAIYAQIAWLVEQPQIYAFAIPVLGVIGSVVPAYAKTRQADHTLMVVMVGLFGFVAIGGWSQPYFFDSTEDVVFVAFGLLAVVPVLGVLGGSLFTLFRGEKPTGGPPAHLHGALAAAVLLFGGVASGAVRVIAPLDLAGTSAITGILNLVVFSAVAAALTGVWFWSPKISGKLVASEHGRIAILALLTGATLLGAADVVAGFYDAPDLLLFETGSDVVDPLLTASVAGGFIIAGGMVYALGGFLASFRSSNPAAGADPWDGHSLEWNTSSPPPVANFTEPPARVVSEAPLLDSAEADNDGEDA